MNGSGPTPDRRGLLAAGVAGLVAISGCSTGGSAGEDGDLTVGHPERTGTSESPTAETADGDSMEGRQFGEALRTEPSFVIEGTIQRDSGEATVQARVHEGDSYWRFDGPARTTELYAIDGTAYVVSDGECLEDATGSLLPTGLSREKFEADREAHATVTPSGRGTVDGESVIRYDLAAESETLSYDLDADSGYPRRLRTSSGVFRYHSWGDVDPIEPPTVGCETLEQRDAG
jgi:hypothetical protein